MPSCDPELEHWFASEVLPHETDLRGWLHTRFPTLEDVDDLVQDSYRRMLLARASGSIACPRAYIFVTARNLALNQLRHSKYLSPRLTDDAVSRVVDDAIPIPETVAHAGDLQLLTRAIQSLPNRCRQVITLRKIYGLSQKQVAKRLDITENTVEAQAAIGFRKCMEYVRSATRPRSTRF